MTTIIEIGNLLVCSDILEEYFCCDLVKCRGLCCVIGDSGAPLSKEECVAIEGQLARISDFLQPKGISAIKEQGAFVKDSDGDWTTPLVHGKECAYAVFADEERGCNSSCLCGIELAYRVGKSTICKPVSCRLHPIRVYILSNGMIALNLHRWHICRDAFAKGKRDSVPVYRFLEEPIIETFGREFYEALSSAANSINECNLW